MKRRVLGILLLVAGLITWMVLGEQLRIAWSMSRFVQITTNIPYLPFERLNCPPALVLPGQAVLLQVRVRNPTNQPQVYRLDLASDRLDARSGPDEQVTLQAMETADFTWRVKAVRSGPATVTISALSSLDGINLDASHSWDHSFRQVCPNLVLSWTQIAIFLTGFGLLIAGIWLVVQPRCSRRQL